MGLRIVSSELFYVYMSVEADLFSVYEHVGLLDVGGDGVVYGEGDGGEFVDWEDVRT